MENLIPEFVEAYFKAHCTGDPASSLSAREFNIQGFLEHANTILLVRADVVTWLESLIVTSVAPIQPIIHQSNQMEELIYLLNVHRQCGVFDLSRSGRISLSTRTSFTTGEPTPEEVAIFIRKNLESMSVYLPLFIWVVFTGMSPQEAFALLPASGDEPGPMWFFGAVECHARRT